MRGSAVELARRDLDGNSRPTRALKIVLSSSRQIEVEPDFDLETLARLVRILEKTIGRVWTLARDPHLPGGGSDRPTQGF